MKVRVRNLRTNLDYNVNDLIILAARRLKIPIAEINSLKLVRRAIDTHSKKVSFIFTVDVELKDSANIKPEILKEVEISVIKDKKDVLKFTPGNKQLPRSPVIVGFGPAGLFCGLLLAKYGYKPVIIEQGLNIEQRILDVTEYWQERKIKNKSNIQFGEGGKSGFSDGKLTTRISDPLIDFILQILADFGANPEITYMKKPYVGTDIIRQIIKKIRQEIIRLGGEVYFSCELTDINVHQGIVESICINNEQNFDISVLVLAVGNSARSIYRMLNAKKVVLLPKDFAIGVRIEHPQIVIDKMQYGDYASHPALGPADYHFTYQDRSTGRSLYTFCMCPNGYVVASASGQEEIVTSGMSYYNKKSGIANSALVVTVTPKDWNNEVLGGVNLQEQLERKAFKLGGCNYNAPAQYLKDFLQGKPSIDLNNSLATYKPGVCAVNLWQLLPQEIAEVMLRGIQNWGKKTPAIIGEETILTGVETRTSAPVRILRNEKLCSVNVAGLYPCGEGAGYAGGLISAAVDGIKVAGSIISTYARPKERIFINGSGIICGSELK